MTPARERELYSSHPHLLIHQPGQGQHLPMHFGIQCGDGWRTLIDHLLRNVQSHADEQGVQPVVLQVKEKLGALRVYWRDADAVVRALTRFAEDLSNSICEVCGCPGGLVTNQNGGRRTRCASHRDIVFPDTPDEPQYPAQRPRSRRRARLLEATPAPVREPPDQVLLDAALLLAQELGGISIAVLQRRLKIGYGRAEQLRNAVLATTQHSQSDQK